MNQKLKKENFQNRIEHIPQHIPKRQWATILKKKLLNSFLSIHQDRYHGRKLSSSKYLGPSGDPEKKEFPQVDTFLGRNRKDSLTKYETRNLPQFLVEKDVNDCDDDAEWKIFFGMILE